MVELKPEIPYLLEQMRLKIAEAKKKNPDGNYNFQLQLIHSFTSLAEDYNYYVNQHLSILKRNIILHTKKTGLEIDLAIANNKLRALEKENENLKKNVEL